MSSARHLASTPRTERESAPSAGRGRLGSLDGLRGLAALVVVIHHCVLSLPSLADQLHAPDRSHQLAWLLTYTPLHLVWAGGEAVLVFFVLSGLVLSRPFLARRSSPAWGAYYRKRLLRLYVPVLAAVALTGLVLALVPRRPVTGWSWWMVAHAVPDRLATLVHDAFLLDGTGWSNSALWSLRYEVYFSLLLPLFVVVVRGLTVPVWMTVPVALWGIGWAASIDHDLLSYMFVFAVGVLLAQRSDELSSWGRRVGGLRCGRLAWSAVVAGGLLLLLAQWWMQLLVGDPTLWLPLGRPAGVLGAAVLVFAFLHCPAAVRFGNSRVLRRLGTVSFSLYLVHEPLVVSVATIAGPTARGVVITLVVGPVVSLLVAALFLRLVEQPSQRLSAWAGRLGLPAAPKPADTRIAAAALSDTVKFAAVGVPDRQVRTAGGRRRADAAGMRRPTALPAQLLVARSQDSAGVRPLALERS